MISSQLPILKTECRLVKIAAFRLLLILSLVLISSGFDKVNAAIINAASVSLSDVQNAVNSANAGDTVEVPAGTATWTSALTINKDIQLIGAGIGKTVIIDGGSPALSPLLSWSTTAGYFDRMTGFTFQGNNNPISYNGSIQIYGFCQALRVDHCEFNLLNNCNVALGGWMYGCIDHCIFYRANVFGVQVHHDAWGGGNNSWGDGSWAAPDYLGTTNSIYVEDNVFTNNGSSPGAFDMEDGGRIVFRYNNLTNDNVGFHGTETSGRLRSGREFEVYNNNFIFQTNTDSSWFCGFFIRGGTGVVFNNYFYNYDSMICVAAYRLYPSSPSFAWPPWGYADGIAPSWDENAGKVFVSSTATASGSQQLTDSSQNWAANQWVTNGAAYCVFDVSQNNAGFISANNANTLYVEATGNSGQPFSVNAGDHYEIGLVYAALDQPGRGQGDLIADTSYNPVPNGIPYETVRGGTNWPNQALDPIYEWNNTCVMPIQNPLNTYIVPDLSPTLFANRDYYDGIAKPGYTPLPYPHPLDTSTNIGSLPSFTLTVVGGTGGGNYTNSQIAAIAANAGNTVSNGAFGFWNGSFIANTNAASTTVTMPNSNLTVTAIYAPTPPASIQATNPP